MRDKIEALLGWICIVCLMTWVVILAPWLVLGVSLSLVILAAGEGIKQVWHKVKHNEMEED